MAETARARPGWLWPPSSLQFSLASPERWQLNSTAFAFLLLVQDVELGGEAAETLTHKPAQMISPSINIFPFETLEAFLLSNGFFPLPPPCLGQMYSNLVRRFLSAQQGFPPVSWQISILFSPPSDLCAKGRLSMRKFYRDRQTDAVLLGPLIAKNTRSDFRELRNFISREGGSGEQDPAETAL